MHIPSQDTASFSTRNAVTPTAQNIINAINLWYASAAQGGYSLDTVTQTLQPGPLLFSQLHISHASIRSHFDTSHIYQAQMYPGTNIYQGFEPPTFSPCQLWHLANTEVAVSMPANGVPVVLPYTPQCVYRWGMCFTDAPPFELQNTALTHELEPDFYPTLTNSNGTMQVFQWFLNTFQPQTVLVSLDSPGRVIQFPDIPVTFAISQWSYMWKNLCDLMTYSLANAGGIQTIMPATPAAACTFTDASTPVEPSQWSINLANIDFSVRKTITIDIGTLQPYSQIHAFTFGPTPSSIARQATLAWTSTSPLAWYITVPSREVHTHYSPSTRTLQINNDTLVFAGNTPQVYTLIDPEGRPIE